MKDIQITAIGEALIDLTQTGVDSRGIPGYVANPGGAPANVAVAAARLGAKAAFIGSVSLTDEPACTTVMEAVKRAAAAGALITYDPNYRAALWPDEQTARERIRMPLEHVDVLKISDEETELLTGERDPVLASRLLMRKGIRLVLVTLGAKGVYYRYGYTEGVVEGFSVTVADTNGAGDTFFGAVLARLGAREGILRRLSERELREILRFANCAAALTTSRPGAIPAMPTLDEVQTVLQGMNK